MKERIRIETTQDAIRFNKIAEQIDANVFIVDGNGLKVNAKSMIGMFYALEFTDLFCECEKDISGSIIDFIVVEENKGENDPISIKKMSESEQFWGNV